MEKLRARTDQEKEERKHKLLISAKKIFYEFGFQGTKITTITNDAGLSTAAFYLYFKSKVEVYRLLSIEGTKILTGMVQQALSNHLQTCEEKIGALAAAYIQFFTDEREYFDIITVHHLGHKDFFANMNLVTQLENMSLELLKTLSAIIQEGVAKGEFRPLDSWKTAVTLWGMMDGVLLMEVKKTTDYIGLDIKELTRHFLQLCLLSLKK